MIAIVLSKRNAVIAPSDFVYMPDKAGMKKFLSNTLF